MSRLLLALFVLAGCARSPADQEAPPAEARTEEAPETDATVWETARQQGVDFRAVGNEPGWVLDLFEGDRIRFRYDYGQREAVVPAPEPTAAAGQTVYRAETEAHDLTVTVSDSACTDTMSGERFTATVTVELDGRTYRGCGRALE